MNTPLSFSHPCFSNDDARVARMHLPVAPRCNIKCGFCRPTVDACAHGCTPGVTAQILSPAQALERLERVRADGADIRIVGIAGPGEPLYNPETFAAVKLIKQKYPDIHVCLSTNGFLLPQKADEIASLGVETLTVTVNAHTLETALHIYEYVQDFPNPAGIALLMERQLAGIERAAGNGLVVKVNTVLVPGVNEGDIPEIAATVKGLGAYIHNILPVIPREKFADLTPPTRQEVARMQQAAGERLPQFLRCQHCRADAIIDADPAQPHAHHT